MKQKDTVLKNTRPYPLARSPNNTFLPCWISGEWHLAMGWFQASVAPRHKKSTTIFTWCLGVVEKTTWGKQQQQQHRNSLELINKFSGVDQQIPANTWDIFLCLQSTTHLVCVFSGKFHHVFNNISGSSQILGVIEPTKAQIWLNNWKITMYYIDLLQQSNSPKTTFLHILLFWPSATTMSLFGFPASATTHGSIAEVPRSIFSWVISLAAMPLLNIVRVCRYE